MENLQHVIVPRVNYEGYSDDPALQLSGNPLLHHAPLFSAAGLAAGLWASESYRKIKQLDQYEFCLILSGRVRLVDRDGAQAEFGPGAAFLIEPGFDGEWHSEGGVRKFYLMLDADRQASVAATTAGGAA
jgi:uncharacterized cupin superfamily protein